jgi:hypothetical protein
MMQDVANKQAFCGGCLPCCVNPRLAETIDLDQSLIDQN